MRSATMLLSALVALIGASAGMANAVSIETVPVGNPDNAGEMSGEGAGGYGPSRICGSVGSAYRIGKFEVTTAQYAAFLNAVAAHGDSDGLYNPQMSAHDQGCGIQRAGLGTVGDPYVYSVSADRSRRPVNFVSWYDAARFCNWLTGGGTETGSYDLTSGDTMAVTRSSGAVYALPSEDEWYKAAFYNAAASDYYLFPTRSNTAPSNDLATPDPGNSANFRASDDDYTLGAPFWMSEVGAFTNSESPYGTYDQAGNVWEWTEEPWDEVARVVRGGSFANTWNDHLMARHRGRLAATDEHAISGFRVVQVPEPATLVLFALVGLMAIRRARRVGATTIPTALVVLLFSVASARALNMEVVTVGNPGNAGELSGAGAGGSGPDRICGAVAYTYQIGRYEVTAGQYCEFLNAMAKTDTYGLYSEYMDHDAYPSFWGCNIKRAGIPGS